MKAYYSKYELGQIVYLITDNEQLDRMVTGILFRDNSAYYYLSNACSDSGHFEIEISEEKDLVKSVTN